MELLKNIKNLRIMVVGENNPERDFSEISDKQSDLNDKYRQDLLQLVKKYKVNMNTMNTRDRANRFSTVRLMVRYILTYLKFSSKIEDL